ncbi:MAG: lytic murein transglycosylase B [Pseudomonadota bacterium]
MRNHLLYRLSGAWRLPCRKIVAAGIALLAATNSFALPAQEQQFVTRMAAKHGFDAALLSQQLQQARHRPSIIKAMSRPAEAKPWHQYRAIFLKQKRIEAGRAFMRKYRKELQRAEETYGVPPHIIAAIIGVETLYGENTGSYPVLEALRTLAFGYPKRAKFFRSELEHYLLMAREESLDPLAPKGSYAGAMGMPQFMPSSFREYAVDFDGNGKRDLWYSPADVIGSVGNYFSRHDWRSGEPVAFKLDKRPPGLPLGNRRGQKPNVTTGSIIKTGAELPREVAALGKAAILEYQQKNNREYWLGMHNFYVITRYNHSNLYAMAVYQLAQEINTISSQ